MKMHSRNREKGFTLVELMAAIVIAGVLLGIAMQTYTSMREKSRVQSAKEEIVSILQQARLKALTSGESSVVTFNWANDSVSYTLRVAESRSYTNVNLQGFACSGTLTSTGSNTMTFKRRGTVSFSGPENLRISSSNSTQVYTIKVNSVTGRIEAKDGGAC